jgi:hypothetical protein
VLGGLDGWNPKTGAVRGAIRVAAGIVKPAAIPKGSVWFAGTMWSADGLTWTTATSAPPAKDARIAAGSDGVLHAVWTTGDKKLSHASAKGSRALLVRPASLEVMAGQNAVDLGSPNLFYDGPRQQWIVSWSCTFARNAIQAFQEDMEHNPRVWYANTADFKTFSQSKLLFETTTPRATPRFFAPARTTSCSTTTTHAHAKPPRRHRR